MTASRTHERAHHGTGLVQSYLRMLCARVCHKLAFEREWRRRFNVRTQRERKDERMLHALGAISPGYYVYVAPAMFTMSWWLGQQTACLTSSPIKPPSPSNIHQQSTCSGRYMLHVSTTVNFNASSFSIAILTSFCIYLSSGISAFLL